ncbi:MAG: alpha/beta fold hydrolase [Litorimonas sp.]
MFKSLVKYTALATIMAMGTGISADVAFAKKNNKLERPYDKFFEDPQFYSPVLSPNGRYLASLRRNGDDSIVIIQDLKNPDAKPAGLNLGDKIYARWINWANDDRLVYLVQRDPDGSITGAGLTRLFGIDKDGKNNKQFFRGVKSIEETRFIQNPISFIESDPENIMIPIGIDGELDVLKLNVNSGKYDIVARGKSNTRQWYADKNGNAAMYLGIRERGRIFDYYAREGSTTGVNAKWRKVRTVKRNVTSNASNLDFNPIAPGPKSSQYYVIARPNGVNTAGVHLYDFETDSFVKEVFKNQNADIRDAYFDGRDGTFEGAMYNKKGKMTFEMEDSTMNKHFKGLEGYFGPGVSASPVSESQDGKKIIFRATGPGDPGSYHLYDLDKRSCDEIGAQMENLLNQPMSTGRVVTYNARDGLELYGYLSQPAGMKAGDKPPLIMFPHGGPEARYEFRYDVIAELLAWKGYQVFQPNFRGSTGRGHSFADKGRGQWGKAMQNDVHDPLLYLDAQGIVDKNQACIMGFSYGGYSALAGATLTPDTYKCVIAGAAPGDLIKMLKSEKAEGGTSFEYWTRTIGNYVTNPHKINAVSPVQQVNAVQAPIFLHHGNRDNIVPFEQGKFMLKALKDAGKDVTWVEMDRVGHSYPRREGAVRTNFYDKLFAFLDKNLPVEK